MNVVIDVKTEPVSEPVSLDELKLVIRSNNGSTEDALLTRLISSCRQEFEFHTDGRVVIATTFYQYQDEWSSHIRLYRGRATSVASVKYYDEDDQLQTLSETVIGLTAIPAVIYRSSFPQLSTPKIRPITIEFTCGWSSASNVPADIKDGILQLAESKYKGLDVPDGFQRLCDKYRTGLVGW